MGMNLQEVVESTTGRLLAGPMNLSFDHLYTDSREVQPGGLFVALRGEAQDGHGFIPDAVQRGATGVICEVQPESAGNVALIQVSDSRQAIADLTRHRLRQQTVPVVAVTGSSGKTTTKELIAHVLGRRLRVKKSQGNLNTYTGIPMTVFELDARDRVLVLEYAMSRSGEIRELTRMAAPSIAVVLNVGMAHVGLLGSLEAVAAAKRELVEGLQPDGLAVLNADDQRVRAMAGSARRVRLYGMARDAQVRAERVRLHGLEGSAFHLLTPSGDSDVYLRIPGPHSIMNALATAAVALEFGFDAPAIASALHGFVPPEHRMNLVPARSGATMIDDCYNANPSSMEAALRTLASLPRGSRIAVLGDMLELGEQAETTHQEIGALAAQTVDRLVVLGDFAPVVVSAARRAGLSSDRAVEVGSAEEAVRVVIPYLNPQARVLVKGSRGMHLEKVVEGLRAR